MFSAKNSVFGLLILTVILALEGCSNDTTTPLNPDEPKYIDLDEGYEEYIDQLWNNVFVPADTPVTAIGWIYQNAENWGSYIINLGSGIYDMPSGTDLYFDGKFVRIIVRTDSQATLALKNDDPGYMVGVGRNVNLILEKNITLKGISNNTEALLQVAEGGKLEMRSGSRICDNKNPLNFGGAVIIYDSFFTMKGAMIDNNEGLAGGGVLVVGASTFTMTESTIKNNVAGNGGGVAVNGKSTFTMTNCVIEDNKANEAGGGVFLTENVIFSMK